MLRRALIVVATMALLAVGHASAAQSVAPKQWFWAKERAELVSAVPDLPKECSWAIYRSGWIGNCVSPNYTYGGATCKGVGARTISDTADVYLYKTFSCRFATLAWTPEALNTAYQGMAERLCEKQRSDDAAYTACIQAALKDRVGTARNSGGMGGRGLWLREAAVKGISTLRVQVTGRFTAIVTWRGTSWKKTIQPSG